MKLMKLAGSSIKSDFQGQPNGSLKQSNQRVQESNELRMKQGSRIERIKRLLKLQRQIFMRWWVLPLHQQLPALAAYCLQTLRAGLALLRDSFAVVGIVAIVTVVVLTQSESLRQSLFNNPWVKSAQQQLLPADEMELLAVLNQETGERTSSMMGLDAAEYPAGLSEQTLENQQKMIARFLARKYRLSEQAVSLVVDAAYDTGKQVGLDPLLILSVMAIESSFNPFAESVVGAQGLMQVMTRVHEDKFEAYGGKLAALNPVANIKVGALVLRDCIRRGGSLTAGLKLYVGATTEGDGGYGAKVLAERARLQLAVGLKPDLPTPVKVVETATAPATTAPTRSPESGLQPAPAPHDPAKTDAIELLQQQVQQQTQSKNVAPQGV